VTYSNGSIWRRGWPENDIFSWRGANGWRLAKKAEAEAVALAISQPGVTS